MPRLRYKVHPPTKLLSSDMSLPRDASNGNKSGYAATFIGRSTIAGLTNIVPYSNQKHSTTSREPENKCQLV